jgi:unsaturated rhamnogalacturonyl hydrolase
MKRTLLLMILINMFLNGFTQNLTSTEYIASIAAGKGAGTSEFRASGSGVIVKPVIQAPEEIIIKIENTLVVWRKDEVFELDWTSLIKKNAKILSAPFVIGNSSTGELYPYQIINDEAMKPAKILVQASFAPATAINLVIKKGSPGTFKTKTYGRYVPERKDDFAWENDKIAFRMYGPALQATGEISNGIDIWVKRTSEMIIDKWYKLNNYHTDHGEGLDCYKVGPTLGAGGIAPVANGKLYYSKNWATYKLIYSGTLRTVFELTYEPWTFNGMEMSENKRITLNAGSQLNKVEVTYIAKGLDSIPVAAGIIILDEKGVMVLNEKEGFISYWEPSSEKYGTIGIGIVISGNKGMSIVENHLVAYASAGNKEPMTYFQGACWDRAGEFKSEESWTKYLREFALKLQTPLIINY